MRGRAAARGVVALVRPGVAERAGEMKHGEYKMKGDDECVFQKTSALSVQATRGNRQSERSPLPEGLVVCHE